MQTSAATSRPYGEPSLARVICDEGDISFFTSLAREHDFEAMYDAADVIRGAFWGNGFSLSCYSKDVCITAERLLGGSLP
ncbi:MAG: hypothetical protein NVSMB48_23590 [Marmoricola sp.]